MTESPGLPRPVAAAAASLIVGALEPRYTCQATLGLPVDGLKLMLATEIPSPLDERRRVAQSARAEDDNVLGTDSRDLDDPGDRRSHRVGKPGEPLGGVEVRIDGTVVTVTGPKGTLSRQISERIAVEHYRELIRFFGEKDPTTRRMLEEILATEEEHANDMHDLLVAHEGKPMLPRE